METTRNTNTADTADTANDCFLTRRAAARAAEYAVKYASIGANYRGTFNASPIVSDRAEGELQAAITEGF